MLKFNVLQIETCCMVEILINRIKLKCISLLYEIFLEFTNIRIKL